MRNKRIVYIAATVLLLVVVFVPMRAPTLKAKGGVRGAMAPAERGVSSLWRRFSEVVAAIRGIGGTAEKNRELSYELVRVQAELNRLRDVEADNVRLRRAFRFSRQQPYAMVPCDVLSRDIGGWWNTVRIGKGSKEGIAANCAVISPDGLVGKTTEVAPRTSEVLLVSDPACRVSAKLARINVFGLVRGAGSDLKGIPRARMEFINKDAEVRIGDEVVTSGLSSAGGAVPKGIHIGYVEKVYRDDSRLFQYAEIVPRATVDLLDYVFVVSGIGAEVSP